MIDGAILAELRAGLNISINRIAERLGLSPLEWIDRVEDRGVRPSAATVITVALWALYRESERPRRTEQTTPARPPTGALSADLVGG